MPDALFRRAEKYAKENRMSRSELYARAVQRLIEETPQATLTDAYNAAFDDDSKDDATFIRTASEHTLTSVEWDLETR